MSTDILGGGAVLLIQFFNKPAEGRRCKAEEVGGITGCPLIISESQSGGLSGGGGCRSEHQCHGDKEGGGQPEPPFAEPESWPAQR